jgi:glycolate oxidase FAD binding subunit
MDDALTALGERVRAAASDRTPLWIRAGGTKDFYGNHPHGEILDPRAVNGVVAYEPTELVITARAGTPLAELELELGSRGQMLAFEPPHFGAPATVGGCIAAGLAGPRRASFGATCGGVRDFVLGAKLLDGQGRLLSFGGTVMKNVAGYDVARALAGSLGILGVIVEVSLKVLPTPLAETTLCFEMSETAALDSLNVWGGRPLPISASVWRRGLLSIRLSGSVAATQAGRAALGGESMAPALAAQFWRDIREHRDDFFAGPAPLWRISAPSTGAPLELEGEQMIEWGGALRWLRSEQSAEQIRARAQQRSGFATLFRGGDRSAGVFPPLSPAAAAIHKRLKAAFDPAGVFNPGRMYPDL